MEPLKQTISEIEDHYETLSSEELEEMRSLLESTPATSAASAIAEKYEKVDLQVRECLEQIRATQERLEREGTQLRELRSQVSKDTPVGEILAKIRDI